MTERALALSILLEIFEKGELSHLALRRGLAQNPGLEQQQRAFLTRLTEGTVERALELDYVIGRYSRTPLKKMKPVIRAILRMGVYQLLYMDGVPDSAVCNEAVKLTARRGYGGLKGFVNGTLRRIAAEKETIVYPPEDTVQGLSVRYSMPEWIVEKWQAAYGEATVRLLQALLRERPLIVHRSASQTSPETIRKSLLAQGVQPSPHPYDGAAWVLAGEGSTRLEELEAFQKGWIQVQDISSQLASSLAVRALVESRQHLEFSDSGRPLCVLDVCAAPGGKSAYVADAALARKLPARIVSRDISEEKTALICQNRDRLGLANWEIEVWDALVFDPTWEQRADVVMADLPCSGLGILSRKSDIKYRLTPDKLQKLAALQRQILSVVWRYVKPGGYLIYSTCTIHSEENEENVRWFQENYPFQAVDLNEWLPAAAKFSADDLRAGRLQLLPGLHDSDGFFMSALQREQQGGSR